MAVHAASFIRERRIVLESALLRRRASLRLILIHELFHFVWLRLNNRQRAAYSQLLLVETGGSARGELGESAEVRKAARGNAWREYVCESFCDTAAWLYSGVRNHSSFTLAQRWRILRAAWFHANISPGRNF